MNIKDAEKATGLKKANIRFYEQEGLLKPKRNEQNNYRQYDQENVNTLVQIKVLRQLGVSVQDINRLFEKTVTIQEVMEAREKELYAEIEQREEMVAVCRKVGKQIQRLQDLDETILGGDRKYWIKKERKVLRLDRIRHQEQLQERLKMGMLSLLVFYWILRIAGWIVSWQPPFTLVVGFLIVELGLLGIWAWVHLGRMKEKIEV